MQKHELTKDQVFQMFKITTNQTWAGNVARQQGWLTKDGAFSLSEFHLFDATSWERTGITEVETQEASVHRVTDAIVVIVVSSDVVNFFFIQ